MLNWTSTTVDASSSHLPIRTFNVQMQMHKHEFILLSPSLKILYKYFVQEGKIAPEQFDLVINTLEEIEKPLSQLCKLFDKPAFMPTPVSLASYQLMILFYYVHEQVHILLSLVTLFRPTYRSKSKRALKQRQEIMYHLDIFIRGCNDVTQKMQDFTYSFDQIRFQERGSGNSVRE